MAAWDGDLSAGMDGSEASGVGAGVPSGEALSVASRLSVTVTEDDGPASTEARLSSPGASSATVAPPTTTSAATPAMTFRRLRDTGASEGAGGDGFTGAAAGGPRPSRGSARPNGANAAAEWGGPDRRGLSTGADSWCPMAVLNTASGVGRCSGSLSRQARMNAPSSASTAATWSSTSSRGGSKATRCRTSTPVPSPNGAFPVTA